MKILVDVRKELLDIPFEEPDPNARDVPFEELLAYAKRISRFTLPPDFRPAPQIPEETTKPSIEEPQDVTMGNGTTDSPVPITAETNVPEAAEPQKPGSAHAALSEEQKAWLESLSRAPFIPWPNEDDMKQGALAALQAAIAQGYVPLKVDGARENQELDQNVGASFEEMKIVTGSQPRVNAGRPALTSAKEEQTFDFGLYNPEEEEEDDD